MQVRSAASFGYALLDVPVQPRATYSVRTTPESGNRRVSCMLQVSETPTWSGRAIKSLVVRDSVEDD